MKRSIWKVTITFVITLSSHLSAFTQTMDSFCKYQGVEYIAGLAHPLSTYQSGRYTVYPNRIVMKIQYLEGETHLILYRRGDYFTGLKVTYDTFFWPAFSVSEAIKDIIVLTFQEDDQNKSIASEFERLFNKTLYNMAGVEMTLVLMTMAWFAY